MKKEKVLFLCTGNSARSQMAEAFLRHYGGQRFEAYSAGLKPQGINPHTRQVMQEAGIDLDGQYSKHIKEYMGKLHFRFLITVCSNAEDRCPSVFPGSGIRLHWNFPDPAAAKGTREEELVKFRQVRDQIRVKIQEWLKETGE